MRRYYLRALFAAVVLIGVPLIFSRSGNRISLDTVLDVSRLSEDALPELLQRIRDFRRVVTRNGKKLLEVSATEASYYRDDSAVVILEPRLKFFDDGQQVGSISGARGRLIVDGNEVNAVELLGDVELVLTQFEIRADTLTYRRDENAIVASGPALLTSPDLVLRGSEISVDLEHNTLRVTSDVDMTLHGRRRGAARAGAGS